MTNAVICAYARSPFTPSNKGELVEVRPDDIAAQVIKGLLSKTGLTPEEILKIIGEYDGLAVRSATKVTEKVIAAAPGLALPLYAGWRAMPLVPDAPGRALQVMFVLRELRAAVHFNALSLSGIAPVEAHMLNKGPEYTSMFGWPQPYPDGADKKERLAEVERHAALERHEQAVDRLAETLAQLLRK